MVQLPTHAHTPDRQTGPLVPSDTPPIIDRRADDPIAGAAKSTRPSIVVTTDGELAAHSTFGLGRQTRAWDRGGDDEKGTDSGLGLRKSLIWALVSAHAVSTFRTVHQIHITCKWAVQSAVVVLSNAQPFSGTVYFTSTVSHHVVRS